MGQWYILKKATCFGIRGTWVKIWALTQTIELTKVDTDFSVPWKNPNKLSGQPNTCMTLNRLNKLHLSFVISITWVIDFILNVCYKKWTEIKYFTLPSTVMMQTRYVYGGELLKYWVIISESWSYGYIFVWLSIESYLASQSLNFLYYVKWNNNNAFRGLLWEFD